MKRSTHHLLAAVLAGLFGLFLTYGSLTSSDFPRGLYGPPNNSEAHWDSIELLNANRLWNYNLNGNPSLATYLTRCYNCSLRAVLTPPGDFYMAYYSCGQHHIYEAEIDFDSSSSVMPYEKPQLFYFFNHAVDWDDPVRGELALNVPDGGASWKCTHNAAYGAGIMLKGPNETLDLDGEEDYGTWASHLIWPDTSDHEFKSIIRVMADLEGLEPTDTIFYWRIYKNDPAPNTTLNSAYYTKASFGGVSSPQWKQFELEYTIPTGGFNLLYTVEWMDKCDFWVDWVEFYDMNRGRYLFEKDAGGAYVYRNATLSQIAQQCRDIETDYGDTLAGWKQSDEPFRSQFDAHGVINLMARDLLARRMQHGNLRTVIAAR